MNDNMSEIKFNNGFKSLKSIHYKQFPSLKPIEDNYTHNGREDDEDVVLPGNPVERRCAKFKVLQAQVMERDTSKGEVLTLNASLRIANKKA